MKICIDPGHKQNYNKGVAAGYYEGNAMLELGKRLKAELEEYEGVQVILTRTTGNDLALAARGKVAINNGCRLFISLHSNAGGGASARGVEIYRSLQRNGSIELGDKLVKAIAATMGTTNRGLKTRAYPGTKTTDYYGVIRAAVKGACVKEAYLIEHGFHSNATDCAWLNKDSNLQKLAEIEATTIAGHYGLKRKAAESSKTESSGGNTGSGSGTLYRVRVGSFSIKANATAMQATLKAKGINSILTTGKSVQGSKLYRVQVGAFTDRKNATALVAELKGKGVTAIIVEE